MRPDATRWWERDTTPALNLQATRRWLLAIPASIFAVVVAALTLDSRVAPVLYVYVAVGGLVALALYTRLAWTWSEGLAPDTVSLASLVVVIVIGALLLGVGSTWSVLMSWLVASAIWMRFGVRSGVATGVICLVPSALSWVGPAIEGTNSLLEYVYSALTVVSIPIGLVGSALLVRSTVALHRYRNELIDAEVGTERLRLSRDLHDLLGQSLSAIALKSDLAEAVCLTDPEVAEREMLEVSAVAQDTLGRLHTVTSGPAPISLNDELAGGQDLLSNAGIDTVADVVSGSWSESEETVLGWAVREGIANVLRHSTAGTCRIHLDTTDGQLHLRIVNDGADQAAARPGTGLESMQQRAAAAGGRAFVQRTGDTFELHVLCPRSAP